MTFKYKFIQNADLVEPEQELYVNSTATLSNVKARHPLPATVALSY